MNGGVAVGDLVVTLIWYTPGNLTSIALATRLLANSPRSGGIAVGRVIKLTMRGGDIVSEGIFILGPPNFIPEAVLIKAGEYTNTVLGLGSPGRTSLGILLIRTPTCQ